MGLEHDEFRVMAYLRGYADGWGNGNHLDPGSVAEQLGFDAARMRRVARRLAALGLVSIYEFNGTPQETMFHPDPTGGPILMDICLTERGWNYLREPAGDSSP
jgi:hypothetical protein